jgi:FAD binding domain/Berberine and berberine like
VEFHDRPAARADPALHQHSGRGGRGQRGQGQRAAAAVRCGGHNVSGKAMSDGGLTIDLSGLREVTVDTERKLVHAGGGCLLATVDAATAQHGLIVPAGIMSVADLALGGGIGWFSRKYGLTCDQFVSLELVLASGEVIEACADQHPDLFWALKGWRRQLRHRHPLHLPGLRLRADDADRGLPLRAGGRGRRAARLRVGRAHPFPHCRLARGAEARHAGAAFVPPELVGRRLLMFISMWLDDADDPAAAEIIDSLCNVGQPCVKAMTVMPFAAGVQQVIDREFEDGHRYYTKEAHVAELADEAIDTLVDFWKDMPMEGEVEIIGLGGAIGDVPENATAFSDRGYLLWLNFAMRWDDPANDSDYIGRTRNAVWDLPPWVRKGVYVNMLDFDEMDRVIEAIGGPEKYARLGRVKAQYAPENFFRMNYNVIPAPAGPAAPRS